MSKSKHLLIFCVFLVLLTLMLPAAQGRVVFAQEQDDTTPTPSTLSPAEVINAVNELRLSEGLNALSIHPVLMEVAANQASALAGSGGTIGHQRPCGMTLGQ